MTMAQLHKPTPGTKNCVHCASPVPVFARYCGECGAPGHHSHGQGFQFPHAEAQPFKVVDTQPQGPVRAPSFAAVSDKIRQINPAVRQELGMMIVLLARERLFLYMHCLIFLTINFFGFWLSIKAHNEYNADELTKTVIALTPLMFINTMGLVCLAPIKGTKQEISRLKERIAYLKAQIEYQNVI
jgi:hypothetical protein